MQWNFNSCEQRFCPCILFNRKLSSYKNKALFKLNVWAKLNGEKSKIIFDLFCSQDLRSSPTRSLGPTSKLLCNRSKPQHFLFVCLFVLELVLWNMKASQTTKLFKPQSFSNHKAFQTTKLFKPQSSFATGQDFNRWNLSCVISNLFKSR